MHSYFCVVMLKGKGISGTTEVGHRAHLSSSRRRKFTISGYFSAGNFIAWNLNSKFTIKESFTYPFGQLWRWSNALITHQQTHLFHISKRSSVASTRFTNIVLLFISKFFQATWWTIPRATSTVPANLFCASATFSGNKWRTPCSLTEATYFQPHVAKQKWKTHHLTQRTSYNFPAGFANLSNYWLLSLINYQWKLHLSNHSYHE